MRLIRVVLLLLSAGLAAACGWSPPGGQLPKADTCTPADGPAAGTVSAQIGSLPTVGAPWKETARGHALNCRLYWVQVAPADATPQSGSPQQVIFFDHDAPIGTATPEPRPYTNVIASGDDTVTVQFQWIQANDQPGSPTGIGKVDYRTGDDQKLEPLDPIPNP